MDMWVRRLPIATRHALDGLLAIAFVWWVWELPDRTFTRWVVEDGYLEWLQVGALVVVLAVCAAQARRWRAWPWAAAAVVVVVAVGEELAWGSRLFSVVVPAVQGHNVQGDLTIHNIGGLRGLSKTFATLAAVGFAGAVAVVRRRPGLAVWFVMPAVYALVRVVDNDPITSRFAKLSEILELVLYAAMARVAVSAVGRRPMRAERPAVAGPDAERLTVGTRLPDAPGGRDRVGDAPPGGDRRGV